MFTSCKLLSTDVFTLVLTDDYLINLSNDLIKILKQWRRFILKISYIC